MAEVSFPPMTPCDRTCPCCGHTPLHLFYEVSPIPTQSNALLRTAREALAFPTGDLRLAHCGGCGFITNLSFDPKLAQSSTGYEATQAFSSTFSSFARKLAQDWIDRYDLHGKRVLEIGCGQGEFLAMLCQLGDNQGVGVDPLFDPARHPAPEDRRLHFVREPYQRAHADPAPDFICCRHTLEHIPNAGEFVRTIRDVIGGQSHIVIAIEVPDTLRVLREGAFWDIYYEHCSYFTPDSLSRLFGENGFEVLDARLEYDGQYLILEAKPAPASDRARTLGKPDTEAITQFAARCKDQLQKWRSAIDQALAASQRVALWGSGSKAVGFLTTLGASAQQVSAVVDINPHKQNTFLPLTGQQIVLPEQLVKTRPDVVIAMNPVYRNEIAAKLEELGLRPLLLTL